MPGLPRHLQLPLLAGTPTQHNAPASVGAFSLTEYKERADQVEKISTLSQHTSRPEEAGRCGRGGRASGPPAGGCWECRLDRPALQVGPHCRPPWGHAGGAPFAPLLRPGSGGCSPPAPPCRCPGVRLRLSRGGVGLLRRVRRARPRENPGHAFGLRRPSRPVRPRRLRAPACRLRRCDVVAGGVRSALGRSTSRAPAPCPRPRAARGASLPPD